MVIIKRKSVWSVFVFLIVAAVVTATVFGILSSGRLKLEIFDNQGKPLTDAKSIDEYKEDGNSAYLDVVLTQAAEIFCEKYSCSMEDAKTKLLDGEYKIYTNFDLEISKNLQMKCAENATEYNVGAAIINLQGDLLAVASCSYDENAYDENYAIKKRQPCSAFKPLSVYAPAIENKIITWSSMYNDSAYSQISTSGGEKVSWPKNANNKYSLKDTTVSDAITTSLNTVAVKCLAQYGVSNSISFLENSFSINLDYEKAQLDKYGENEVIGNIALGSTNIGLSPIDMAGYYQIFANGGNYSKPKAITKITDSDDVVIYQYKQDSKQVISKETSQIMNELLQNVVTDHNGTGRDALCKNTPVCGKTGTGDDYVDNWFVGVTPQYSCAIWHSKAPGNNCAKIFSDVFQNIDHEIKLFSTYPDVAQRVYCLQTGKLANKNCKTFSMGIYAYGTHIPVCDVHK